MNDLNNISTISYLDRVRITHSTTMLKATFHDIARNSPQKALQMINAPNLSFASLFAVLPLVHGFGMYNRLSARNLQAAVFCKNPSQNLTQPVLRWVLDSALAESVDDDFDEMIDRCIAKLLMDFRDKTVLQRAAELIFKRHREGRYMHDLVFCFFGLKEPETMSLVANYIRSDSQSDNQLAYQMLNFKPELQPSDKEKQYENYHSWLTENQSFLYAPDESMQRTSNPKYFRVDLTAKYLCSLTSPPRGLAALTPIEKSIYTQSFEGMERDDQKMLAKYSYRVHERDLQAWSRWMKAPMEVKVGIAKAELGGLR